jgi:hypothetical protein
MRIIVQVTKNIFKCFQIQWLHPSSGLEPRSTNHISTVLTARPRLQYNKAYVLPVVNRFHVNDIIGIIDIFDIIDILMI